MSCLDQETAVAYLTGELESAETEQLALHLQECVACRALVEEISGVISKAREVLLVLDEPALEGNPPSIETIRSRLSVDRKKEEHDKPGAMLSIAAGSGVVRGTKSQGFLVHAAVVFAAAAGILLAAILFWSRTSSVSASELLRNAQRADGALAAPGQVIHRTYTVEERQPNREGVVARRRVEVWQSPAAHLTVRRSYDESGTLLEGEWLADDGQRKIYRPGGLVRSASATPSAEDNVWQGEDRPWHLDPSALSFSRIVPAGSKLTVSERENEYLLSYRANYAGGQNWLISASLLLSRPGLEAIQQTLLFSDGDRTREFSFRLLDFVRLPAGSISPAVFQPEALLLPPASRTVVPRRVVLAPPPAPPKPDRAALLNAEIRVLHSLDNAGALLGEQVNVSHDDQKVRVSALVDTEERRAQLMDALKTVGEVPGGLEADVETYEAAANARPAEQVGPLISREVEVDKQQIPVAADLRRYFLTKLGASVGQARIDSEVNQFAQQVLDDSRQMLLQAWALKRIVSRYSSEDLRQLDSEALGVWQSMIREHAGAIGYDAARVRESLTPVFPQDPNEIDAKSGDTCGANQDLPLITECLLELAYAQDEAVRKDFALSVQPRSGSFVRTVQFWSSLKTLETAATKISESR
jgi:hypothetical protein